MPLRTGVLARPGLSLANLLYGDVGAAGQALYDPEGLSPLEARDLADRMGMEPGPFTTIMRTVTNPFVLLGLVLGAKYPVPGIQHLSRFSKKVAQETSRYGPLSGFRSLLSVFKDMPEVPAAVGQSIGITHNFRQEFLVEYAKSLRKYETAAGRSLSTVDSVAADLWAQGLHRKLPGRFRDLKVPNPLNAEAIEARVTGPLREFAGDMRTLYDRVWQRTFDAKGSEVLLRARIGDEAFDVLAPDVREQLLARGIHSIGKVGRYVEGYGPKMLAADLVDKDSFWRIQQAQMLATEKSMAARVARAIKEGTPAVLKHRKDVLAPDPRRLRLLVAEGLADPQKLDEYTAAISQLKPVMVGPKDFQTAVPPIHRIGFGDTFVDYVNMLAPLKGWSLSSAKETVEGAINKLRLSGVPGDGARAGLLRDTVIPLARGKLLYKQAMAAQQWGAFKYKASQIMEAPWFKNLPIPKGVTTWMQDALRRDRGPLSLANLSGGMAGYLYLSTLGLNAGSAALNMMQTAMTTYPLLGGEATAAGISRVFKRVGDYMRLRGKGTLHEDAVRRLFPEFAEAGLISDPIAVEAMQGVLHNAWDSSQVSLRGRFAKGIDRVSRGMMEFFSASESFNRLVAWEGAMHSAARSGLSPAMQRETAKRVVELTQFSPNLENQPIWLLGKNPLAKQFLAFGMKSLEFLTDTATTAYSGTQAGALGRNWGTLGRAAAAGGAIYELGQGLDLDLSGALTGGLPVPYESQPFSPFPFVPPAASLVGSAAQAVLFGETENLRRATALLAPGGVAVRRAAGLLPGLAGPGTGGALGRDYVDYNVQSPDGRFPVYSRNGSLIGYETPWELTVRGLGLPGAQQGTRAEPQVVHWLTRNRDRIRELRRGYLQAKYSNDVGTMMRLEEQHQRAYGFPLQIKESDERAWRLRMDVPRLERVLAQLPEEYRPMFATLLQGSILAEGSQFLGTPASGLMQGGPAQRVRGTSPSEHYQRQGQYSLRPTGGIEYDRLGRQELPAVGAPGF